MILLQQLGPRPRGGNHDSFVVRQHDTMNAILAAGVAKGVFAPHDVLTMEHLIFGPPVTLSREMFASFEDRDALLPVERVRDGHCDLVLRLLEAGGSGDGA
jgi:hypothetical protein